MGRTTCTEPQCLYRGDLYIFLHSRNKQFQVYYNYSLHVGHISPSPRTQAFNRISTNLLPEILLTFGTGNSTDIYCGKLHWNLVQEITL